MKCFITAVLAVLVFAGIATAMSVSDNDYFVASGITFQDQWEFAGYESDFGLFSMVDPTNKYEIFSYLDEPGFLTLGSVSVADWSPLAEGFGFYFDVHTGGRSDVTADYNWFSDQSLNQFVSGVSVDTDIEHVGINFISANLFQIYLDDQLGGGDRDFNDMIIGGFTCSIDPIEQAAPVPEPTTMFLFGTGIAGLAGIRLKKSAKIKKQ